jgi:hypothetical protein
MNTLGNLALDQGYKGIFVHLTVLERCDQGRNSAVKLQVRHGTKNAVKRRDEGCGLESCFDNRAAGRFEATALRQ